MSAAERLRKSKIELRSLERAFTEYLFAAIHKGTSSELVVFADDTSFGQTHIDINPIDHENLQREGSQIVTQRRAFGYREPFYILDRYLKHQEIWTSKSEANSDLILRFLREVDLRYRLPHAFAPLPFTGVVSTHEECDEGIALRRELWGKSWDDVPTLFVDSNPLSLHLLEPEALVAFVPAWMSRSLDMLDHKYNDVVCFTQSFLCPKSRAGQVGLVHPRGLFEKRQRRLIFDFLQLIEGGDDRRGLALWSDAYQETE